MNTAPDDDPLVISGAHYQALAALEARGVRTVHTPVRAFPDAMTLEHESYAELGPVLGAFYDPGQDPVTPLTVPVSAVELLEVSLVA